MISCIADNIDIHLLVVVDNFATSEFIKAERWPLLICDYGTQATGKTSGKSASGCPSIGSKS